MITISSSNHARISSWTAICAVIILMARFTTSENSNNDFLGDDDSLEDFDSSVNDDDIISSWMTPIHHPGAIDFRDLFLTPAEALALGATGLQPYGNLFHTYVWPNLEGLTQPDPYPDTTESGLGIVNSQLIEPFTLAQSGINGSLIYPDLLDLSVLGDRLQIKVSSFKVTNLNTLLPFKVVQPGNDPHVLSNSFQVGGSDGSDASSSLDDQEVEIVVRLGIGINGSSADLHKYNEVDIRATVPKSSFLFDLVVLVDQRKLLNMPLSEILNVGCWMDTLVYTDGMSESGVNDDEDDALLHQAIHLQKFQAELAALTLDVTCVDCSPSMEIFLPKLMTSLQPTGITTNATTSNSTTFEVDTTAKPLMTTRVERLVEDAVRNIWEIMDLHTVIREAARFCPHNPRFIPPPVDAESINATLEKWSLGDLSSVLDVADLDLALTRASFETVLAGGIISGQATMVATAQQYLTMNPKQELQALPVEFALGLSLNETEFEKYVDWADYALLKQIRQLLIPDNINALIQDSLVDPDTNALTVPFLTNLTIDTALGYLATIEKVTVTGLDTLTTLKVLDPISRFGLETEVQWEELYVHANLSMIPSNGKLVKPEYMTLSMQFYDIRMFLDLILPIDLEQLGELQLGAILQGINNVVPCIMASSKNSSIESLNVTIGSMEYPTVEGFLSPDLQSMVNSASANLFRDFEKDMITALPNIFQTTVKDIANEFILSQYQDYEENEIPNVCAADLKFATDGLVDFRDLLLGVDDAPYGTYIQAGYTYLTDTFFNEAGVMDINRRIGALTNSISNVTGGLTFEENAISATSEFVVGNLLGKAEVNVWNITIRNIDSLGLPFRLLYPTKDYVLENNVSVGAGSKPLTLGANIMFAATDGEEMDIHNEFSVSIAFDDIMFFVKILLKLAEKALLTFPMKSIDNVYCWLALLPPQGPSELLSGAANTSGLSLDATWEYDTATLNLDCSSCTSPDLPELVERLYRRGETEYDAIEAIGRRVVDSDAVRSIISQFVYDAPALCPHSEEYNPEVKAKVPGSLEEATENLEEADVTTRDHRSQFFNIGFAGFGAIVLVAFIILKVVVRRKNNRWENSLSIEGEELLRHVQDRERDRTEYLDEAMSSLYHSVFIPAHARVLVPVAIVLNICLFIVAHTAISIVMGVAVNLAGDEFMIHSVFEFNFADGLRNTYRNGGYEMAIMLLIFGGIWPYFKCLLSLVLWFAPPQVVPAEIRGRMLLWIDAMNKLTVRDIFKFLIIIAIIFVYVGGPFVWSEAVGDLYSVKLIAVPGPAIYCGITAMIISRVSSRWLWDYHIQAMDSAQRLYHEEHVITVKEDEVDESGVTGGIRRLAQGSAAATFCSSNDSSADIRDETTIISKQDIDNSKSFYEEDSEADFEESEIPMEILIEERRFINICGRRLLMSTFGIYLGIFVALIVLLIGLIFVPKISIDLSAILSLFLESGTTYKEAISAYGVYSFICAILLQARILLESSMDYIALGCLLLIGLIATIWLGVVNTIRYLCDIRKEGWRRIYPLFFEKDEEVLQLPAYLRLYAYKYFTVYVVAYVIGIFQLGTVTIYAIHYFCSILDNIYGALTFVGIIPATSGQCWEAQTSHVHNSVVFFGCFLYLTYMFIVQLTYQYRLNVRHASDMIAQQHEESAFFDNYEHSWKDASVKPFGSAVLKNGSAVMKKISRTISRDTMDSEMESKQAHGDDSSDGLARSRLNTVSTATLSLSGLDVSDSDSDEEEDCPALASYDHAFGRVLEEVPEEAIPSVGDGSLSEGSIISQSNRSEEDGALFIDEKIKEVEDFLAASKVALGFTGDAEMPDAKESDRINLEEGIEEDASLVQDRVEGDLGDGGNKNIFARWASDDSITDIIEV